MHEHDTLPRCLFAPVRLAPDEVAAYRRDHDPLDAFCPPHVTFVFPFRSTIEDDAWIEHIAHALDGHAAFEVSFAPAQPCPDGTVQLPITLGSDICRAIHGRLYRGPLQPHLSAEHLYTPHVTIGRRRTGADERVHLPRAAPATVDTVIFERIGPNDESLPIHAFRLL